MRKCLNRVGRVGGVDVWREVAEVGLKANQAVLETGITNSLSREPHLQRAQRDAGASQGQAICEIAQATADAAAKIDDVHPVESRRQPPDVLGNQVLDVAERVRAGLDTRSPHGPVKRTHATATSVGDERRRVAIVVTPHGGGGEASSHIYRTTGRRAATGRRPNRAGPRYLTKWPAPGSNPTSPRFFFEADAADLYPLTRARITKVTLMPFRIVLAALALLLVLPSLAELYTEWFWFGEIEQRQIFLLSIITRFWVGAAAFIVGAAVVGANLWHAVAGLPAPHLVIGRGGELQPLVIDWRGLRLIAAAAAVAAGVGAAMYASQQWLVWLQFRHATPFDTVDPLLGRDVGFYVFALPFYDAVRYLLLGLVAIALVAAAVIYVLAGVITAFRRVSGGIEGRAQRHLTVLAAVMFLLLAWGAYLDIPRLLTTPAGVIHGASYADVIVRIPALRAQIVVLLIGAALAAYAASSRRIWPLPVAIGLYGIILVGGTVAAAAVQRFIVTPNEQEQERPYIEHNVASTRAAFALEEVETRELTGDATLTAEDIARNAPTIENVRLWDHEPLLDTFGQLQEIRTYYDFVSVDNDRYVIDGTYRQTMLSARELDSESLPNRTWPNERLTFTHGYGVALGPVNEVTREGLPVLFVGDLPPQSTVDLQVDEPAIYYGEISSDYVLVQSRAEEFHYPRGDNNVYATYEGQGGVRVGGLLRRLLFSLRFRSLNILVSNQITSDTRILFHRRVAERASHIAPFLSYDPDPYLVIADSRLYWILDAYTVTDRYPYAMPAVAGLNYIRNSIKIVIDAYDGTTTFYLADAEDPLARTLGKIFPEFLQPLSAMPDELQRHVRYPETIFSVQTEMYATYHMTNPAVFYNKEDQWEVPAIDREGRPMPMEPYYTIMKLPGETSAEFIQMLPFTPRRRDNLAAWMVARSDPANYGRLFVYQFPKQKVIFGPRQIVARINQDQVIAPQITLWDQQGSEVIQGTLLVVPIEESLLYIRPLYLRGSGSRIPELKRVIVAYQNQIVMEETLTLALDRLFGRRPAATPEPEDPDQLTLGLPAPEVPVVDRAGLATQARDHYQRAILAQREGNWSLYGEELRKLGEVLDSIAREGTP